MGTADLERAITDERRTPFDDEGLDQDGIGMCLSGGGFKAAAFHLGGLIRLNELGYLPRLSRIASVSGGSITAGLLASQWSHLNFDKHGVGQDFEIRVASPLREFLTETNIDVTEWAMGAVLPFRDATDGVARAYDKHLLHGATLQSLPDAVAGEAPEFAFLSTSYQLNNLWVFGKAQASNYRVGRIMAPNFPLAKIVTASSAFPPFFCPMTLDFGDQKVEKTEHADCHKGSYLEKAELADGGIYDNLGLEPIFKKYRKLIVSNAGDPFQEAEDPTERTVPLMRRVLSMIHRQAENNRARWLMDLVRRKERELAMCVDFR